MEWDDARGFGFLEFEGRRVFLHRREFAERHKRPEVGDRIAFNVGQDAHGRICATRARHVDDGGRVSGGHLLVLLGLLVAPVCAIARSPGQVPMTAWAGYALTISLLTFGMYWHDKNRARRGEWRVPEIWLHILEAIGGWAGAFLAQRKYRHKTAKFSYQFVFWSIVAAYQYVAIDRALGGRLTAEIRRLVA